MSPRKTILRELGQRHARGETGYTRPGSIAGFDADPAAYQAAVNGLLADRLINGGRDEDGRLAITLNPVRLEDVRRELRPLWTRPVVRALALAAAGLLGLGWFLF